MSVSKVCRHAVPAYISNYTSASCLRIYRPAQYMIHFEFMKGFDAYKLSLQPAVFLMTYVLSLQVVENHYIRFLFTRSFRCLCANPSINAVVWLRYELVRKHTRQTWCWYYQSLLPYWTAIFDLWVGEYKHNGLVLWEVLLWFHIFGPLETLESLECMQTFHSGGGGYHHTWSGRYPTPPLFLGVQLELTLSVPFALLKNKASVVFTWAIDLPCFWATDLFRFSCVLWTKKWFCDARVLGPRVNCHT